MASSGWQGKKNLSTSSFGYESMKCDIYISSITHSGTSLTITGKFGVYNASSSGYMYYYYPIKAKISGQSSYTQVASANQRIYAGQYSAQADFSTTLSVTAASTSKNVTVDWLYNNGTASNSYTYTLTYNASTASFKVTGTNVTFDIKLGGTTVASDSSSYTNNSVAIGTSYQITDIKAKSGYYYTGSTSASGTVNSNTTLSYSATGRTYTFNVNVMKGTTEDSSGGTGTFNYSITSAAGGAIAGNNVGDYYNSALPNNSTYTISGIQEKNSSNYYYTGQSSYSGKVTANTTIKLPFSAVVAPSGVTVTNVSHTTSSITWKVSVSSFGAPSSASGRYIKLYNSSGTLIGTISNATSGNITHNTGACASGYVYAIASNTHKTTRSSNVSYDLSQYGYPEVAAASFTTVDATTATVTMAVSNWNGYCSSSQGYFTYSYSTPGGQVITGTTSASANKTATVTLSNLTTDANYTLNWVAHNTAGNTTNGAAITFHSVRTPAAPSLTFTFTNANRTCTMSAVAGTIYDSATLASTTVELSLDSAFATILDSFTFTTASYDYVKQYVKPYTMFYARAKTTNSLGMVSEETLVDTFSPRIVWGVVNISGSKYDIIDMRRLNTDGTLTPANWVEGTLYGKNRVVKKEG